MFFNRDSAIYPRRTTPYGRLRRAAHRQADIETRKRMIERPNPTREEIALGTFTETIEPQVRDAVRELNRKGYSTWSSGFYGNKDDYQAIDGPFTLDDETCHTLRKMGCDVRTRKHFGLDYTSIGFNPDTPDLAAIRRRWRKIASVIPDLGHRAPFSDSMGAQAFRETFGRDTLSIERQRHRYAMLAAPTRQERTTHESHYRIYGRLMKLRRRYSRLYWKRVMDIELSLAAARVSTYRKAQNSRKS